MDPARDAVLVIAPGPPPGPLTTTVASLRAPGLRPGLLRSAYTRRAGVVALVDVAPTVLDLLDIERPSRMEGRPFEFGRTDGDLDHRIDWLADTNDRAQFRDRAITQAGGVFAAFQFTLAGAALILLTRARRRGRGVVALELASLMLLFAFPATYLAALLPFAYSGLPAFWLLVVVASGAGVALVYATTDRRGVASLIVALWRGRRCDRRRCAHRRALAVQRHVRLLADHRRPLRGARQPGFRAARVRARCCSRVSSRRASAAAVVPGAPPRCSPSRSWWTACRSSARTSAVCCRWCPRSASRSRCCSAGGSGGGSSRPSARRRWCSWASSPRSTCRGRRISGRIWAGCSVATVATCRWCCAGSSKPISTWWAQRHSRSSAGGLRRRRVLRVALARAVGRRTCPRCPR